MSKRFCFMKSSIFWDITLCSQVRVSLRVRETYHRHIQGRRVSQIRNQYQSGSKKDPFYAVLNRNGECQRVSDRVIRLQSLISAATCVSSSHYIHCSSKITTPPPKLRYRSSILYLLTYICLFSYTISRWPI
jgi:hypothetical protein